MRTLLLLLPLLFSLSKARAQTNLYVDSSAATSGNGTTWGMAYKTLNEALNVANAASTTVSYTIHLAKGTYYPTGAQNVLSRDSAFAILRSGIRVYGGYPSGGGVRDVATNPTILSGEIGFTTDSSDNAYHVVVMANLFAAGDSVILDGLTITRGNANGTGSKLYGGQAAYRSRGGGIWMKQVEYKTRLRNCTLQENYGNDGGGFYGEDFSLYFTNNSFIGNKASNGGAVYSASSLSSPVYQNCFFQDNSALDRGGAVYTGSANAAFWDCTFSKNGAQMNGGAIYANAGLSATRSSFAENTAPNGGALYLQNGATIDTCIFSGNHATVGDGGAIAYLASLSSSPSLICNNTIFSDNAALLGNGGAITELYHINPSLYTGCTFSNDSAMRGGALYVNAPFKVGMSSFVSNYASNQGGAVYNTARKIEFVNSLLSGNKAGTAGGALYLNASNNSSSFTNLVISGNWAGQQGGAMVIFNSSPTLENVTLAGDSAVNGNGLYCDNASPDVKNCIVWEGATNSFYTVNTSYPTVNYSLVEGGFAGTGNLSSNPAFIAPQPATAAPTTAGNYALTGCSAAINAGQNNGFYTGAVDFMGNTRLVDNVVDMGAYEFPRTSVAGTISGPGLGCVGSPIQLTPSVSGGTWSSLLPSGATVDASGLVTPLAAGPVTIRYTVMANGCPVSAVISITIQSVPQTPVIANINNGAPVCVGTLYPVNYISQNGGIWAVGDTSITNIQSFGAPAYFKAKAVGTTDIILTAIGTNGCTAADTISVTVNPLPTVPNITGGDTLCAGTTMQLSNPLPGGTWSQTMFSGGFTVSSTGLVSSVVSGDGWATYTITDAQGCMGIDSQSIHVNPSPAVAPPFGPATICVGTPVTYTHPMPGGTWSVYNTRGSITAAGVYTANSIAGGNNVFYTIHDPVTGCPGTGSLIVQALGPVSTSLLADFCQIANYNFNGRIITAAGVYKDTLQTYYGCDSVVTLTYTKVGPDDGVTQSGNILKAVQSGATYQWFRCEANGGTTALPIYGRSFVVTQSGRYGVFVTNSYCTVQSACYAVNASGVSNIAMEDWKLYPNPTTGSTTLQTGSVIAKSILVRDITGKLLLETQPTGAETVLDLKGFAVGLYLVAVADGEGNTATLRLTVAK